MSDTFTCGSCGSPFTVPAAARKQYPGWKPKTCMSCRFGRTAPAASADDALARFDAGPSTGVFTDGACDPNPGPGGWGAVLVVEGAIRAERNGHDPSTTNNRMELTALIEGYKMLAPRDALPVYSDSRYCVRIINEWAEQWQANGWRRGKKREPVENIDLVRELFDLAQSRPLAQVSWIRGHAGSRWNEYADVLSRAYLNGNGHTPSEHREAPKPPGTLPLL
jgi:ribonuclease HI